MRERRVQKRQLLLARDGCTKSWNVKPPAWVCCVEEHKARGHCRRRRGGCKGQGAYRRTAERCQQTTVRRRRDVAKALGLSGGKAKQGERPGRRHILVA